MKTALSPLPISGGDIEGKRSRVDLDIIVGTWKYEHEIRYRSRLRPDCICACVLHHRIALDGLVVKLRPKPFRMAVAMIARRGSLIEHDEIWFLFWGERVDGGPDFPKNSVRVLMREVEAALAILGYRIETSWGRGYIASPAISTPALQAAE